MKKMLFIFTVLLSCTALSAFSAQGYVFTPENTKSVYSQSLQRKNLPYAEYLKYYNLNPEKIDAEFIILSGSEENNFEKTLSKEEKKQYKYVKKIQKLISKNDWNEVFSKYPNFFPAYIQYYDLCYQKANYAEALRILNKIRSMDMNAQVFDKDLIDYSFGILYFMTGQYTSALNYFKMYENSGDDFIISSIANCYFAMGNYTAAINYSKKLKQPEYKDKELLYSSYLNLKDYQQANKYAMELLNQNYSYENLMKVQATNSNKDTKLSYCYKARNLANSDKDIYYVNQIIAKLEQEKLDKAALKVTQFVKVPKWSEFEKQLPENVSESEISLKQDEFFKTANLYLTKYKGQELTNAFNSLNLDYNTYIQNKQNRYYQEKQLQAQEALLQEQQRNNLLQQQMIYEQQIRNSLERQHFYYMSRPYYYMHPGRYGWWY